VRSAWDTGAGVLAVAAPAVDTAGAATLGVPVAVDMLARGTSEASADMVVAARSVVGSSRRGTSAMSPAGISASSAITTTVTASAASSPWAYRSASRPIPSTRRIRMAPIRTVIPLRPGTTPRTATGATATSNAVATARPTQVISVTVLLLLVLSPKAA